MYVWADRELVIEHEARLAVVPLSRREAELQPEVPDELQSQLHRPSEARRRAPLEVARALNARRRTEADREGRVDLTASLLLRRKQASRRHGGHDGDTVPDEVTTCEQGALLR